MQGKDVISCDSFMHFNGFEITNSLLTIVLTNRACAVPDEPIGFLEGRILSNDFIKKIIKCSLQGSAIVNQEVISLSDKQIRKEAHTFKTGPGLKSEGRGVSAPASGLL